jgi:hypothetical protein
MTAESDKAIQLHVRRVDGVRLKTPKRVWLPKVCTDYTEGACVGDEDVDATIPARLAEEKGLS